MSFIFGGNTPWTAEDLKKKREIADALALANTQTPQNVGEGLNAIGRALAYRGIMKRANKEESRLRDQFDAKWNTAFGGGGMAPQQPAFTPAGPPLPPPDPNSPHALGDAAMAALGKPAVKTGADPASIKAGLVARGMPEHIADGFVMNFQDESGMNPGINEVAPLVPGSRGGFGLAQWTGPRRKALEAFAASQGKPVSDVDVQLDFLMSELQGPESAAWSKISGAQNAGEAGAAIVNSFLRPAEQHRSAREAEYLGGGGLQGMDIGSLVSLASDPMASPQQQAVVNALIQQQLEAADPLRRIEMEKAQLELAQMKNPKPGFTMIPAEEAQALGLPQGGVYQRGPNGEVDILVAPPEASKPPAPTDDMREYEFAKSQGYTGTFQQYQTDMKKAGASSVSVSTGSEVGTIPQGFELFTDPATGARSMRPIPGGPEDTSGKDAKKAGNAETAASVVTTAAERALAASKDRALGGFGQGLVANLPWTDSAEVARQVDVLKANAKVDNLQAMRDASPTGGALGSVTEGETAMLAAKSGALDPSSPNFERDLADYTRTLLRVVHGPEEGDRIFAETWKGAMPDGAQPQGTSEPANITNDAEYEALPSGAVYIGPDGVKRRKP
jgi:hypothetical protein